MTDRAAPAVSYGAKSTADARGSIPAQLAACRAMAEREGWEVIGEFSDEGFSAFKGNRGPGLEGAKHAAAAAAAEHGECMLVVAHSDRIARGAGDAPGAADHLAEVYFWARRNRVRLRSVEDDANLEDAIRAVLIGERNTEDSRRKALAVRAGKRRQAERGRALGPLSDGYKLDTAITDGQVVTHRVVDPARAPVIGRIFDFADEGATPGDIARRMNAEGTRAPRGGAWTTRVVRAVLRNVTYAGFVMLDGERRPADHEPLIDPERFDRIQAKLGRLDPAAVQVRKGGRRPVEDYMLRGIARCGRCGGSLYTRRYATGRHYICGAVREARGVCDALPIPAAPVETEAFMHLSKFGLEIGAWLQQRSQERATEHEGLQRAVEAERARLADHERVIERAHAQHARLLAAGDEALADAALRSVGRLEAERESITEALADAQARAQEWTPSDPEGGLKLDWWNDLAEAVNGRLASAQGVADVRAVLRDLLAGIWIDRRPKKYLDPIKMRFVLRAPDDVPREVVETTFADMPGFPAVTAEDARQAKLRYREHAAAEPDARPWCTSSR